MVRASQQDSNSSGCLMRQQQLGLAIKQQKNKEEHTRRASMSLQAYKFGHKKGES